MRLTFRNFCSCCSGSVAIEYAIIGSIVSVFIVYSLKSLNVEMVEMFDFIATKVASRDAD